MAATPARSQKPGPRRVSALLSRVSGSVGRISKAGLVAVGVLAGVLLRVWILSAKLGGLDSDEAIVGLMARHFLEGELTTFFWGQTYGGTQETLLTAIAFLLFEPSVLILKLVPILLNACAAILVWRVGRRLFDETTARFGAVLFWVWPTAFVWALTRARGYYGVALVCGLLIILFTLRLRETNSLVDALGLGLAAGIGWWATTQIILVAIPCAIWLVVTKRSALKRVWAAAPAAIVGAAPWIRFNIAYPLASLRFPAMAVNPEDNEYSDHVVEFFRKALPGALGMRVPFSLEWVLGAAGILLYIGILGAFAFALIKKPQGAGPLLLLASAYPFILSASTFTWYVVEPRYLLLLAPVAALLIARGLRSEPLRWGCLVVAVLLSFYALQKMEQGNVGSSHATDIRVPVDMTDLIRDLRRNGIDRVYADYWIAHRISFESEEEVIAASVKPETMRYPPHQNLVASATRPAFVIVEGSAVELSLVLRFRDLGIEFDRFESDGFVTFVADRKVDVLQFKGVF